MTFKVKDGISVAGTLFVDSLTNVTIVSTATSINSTTGALVVAGGIGVKGNIYAGNIYTNGQLIGASSTTATNLSGGTVGSIPIQSGLGQTGFIPISSTSGYVLMAVGITATWVSTSSLGISASGGNSNNIQGGTTGALLYQSAPGVTSFIGIGPAGTLLQSNGTTATWVSSSTFGAGFSGGTVANSTIFQNTVTLTSSTISLSTTTGALIVQGGIGVGGNVNIAGAVTGGGIRTTSTSTAPPNPTVGDIWYVTGSDIVARYTSDGTSTYWLDMSGPSFAGIGPTVNVTNPDFNTGTLVSRSVNALSLSGGAPGAMPYQTQFGVTTFVGIGPTAFVLTSNGTQPVWQALAGIASGSATTASNIALGFPGAIPYQNNTGSTVFTGPGNQGDILISQGINGPTFVSTAQINVSYATTASALTGGTVGSIPIQSAFGKTGFIPLSSTSGYVLQVVGSTATWVSTSTLGIGIAYNTNTLVAQAVTATYALFANTSSLAVTATNIAGGLIGQIPYQTNTGTTAFFGPGTLGQILVSQGTSTPQYINTAAIHVGAAQYAQTSNNLSGGTAGQIPYQSTPGSTLFVGPGTAGQLLMSGGTNGPLYANTASIHVAAAQYAVTATNLVSTGTTHVRTAQFAVTATNLAGGVAGGISYQQAPGTTSFIGIGPTGSVLVSNGTTSTFGNTINSLTLTSNTDSNDTGTGALIVAGGAGIGNRLTVGGQATVLNNTAPSDTATGALVVAGGVGIGGDVFINGTVSINGSVSGGSIRTTTSPFAPNNPTVGDMWYDSVFDILSRYTNDGGGNYWLDISSPSISGSGPTTSTTVNITGNLGGASVNFATPTVPGTVLGYTTSTRKNVGLGYCTGISAATAGCCNIGIGIGALATSGAGATDNIAIGTSVLSSVQSCGNIGIGQGIATQGTVTGANGNIAIGCNIVGSQQGCRNILLGSGHSLSGSMVGCRNIMIGEGSMYFGATGSENIALGSHTMYGAGQIVAGNSNISFGSFSLNAISNGSYNIAVGSNALRSTTDGQNNISLGCGSLYSNITGNCNIAVGYNALCNNNIGYGNVAIGSKSSSGNTYGKGNTVIGQCSFYSNTSGSCNVAVGYGSGVNYTGGNNNVTVGNSGGFNYGFSNVVLGTGHVPTGAIGCSNFIAGNASHNGAGCYNITIGTNNLSNTAGSSNNIAFGNLAIASNTTGNCNIGMGPLTMYSNTTGFDNVAIGTTSLFANTYGNNNVAVGLNTLRLSTIGCNNTAIGSFAGCTNAGSNNTFIGYNAQGQSSACNNTITLGNTSIACIRAQVAMTTFSDCRDKTNICSIPVGLDFVRALRPVKFEWNMRDNPTDGKKGMTEPGFLAQELAEVVEQFDANWMNLVHKDDPDRLEATISRLLPVAIRAIQELSIEVDRLRSLIETPISNQ
jgi:trimeric autotransporter adhesin